MSKRTHPDHGFWIFRSGPGGGSKRVGGWQLVKGLDDVTTYRKEGETLEALQRRHLAACRKLPDCPRRPVSVALPVE